MYTPKKAYFYGTGRRKSSVARVRLIPGGSGQITINNREFDNYFGLDTLKTIVKQPLELVGVTGQFDLDVKVQGGGFTADFVQKPTSDPIKNEADNQLSNKRGTLAMARTSVVDSATAQFFINLVDNDFLDFKAPTPQHFGYCVFGEVVEGMDVVDQIAAVKTGSHQMHRDVPTENIVILDAVRD